MKKIFFTPGPAQLYSTVEKHIKNALETNVTSISHRSKKFEEIYKTAATGIRKLLNIPKDHNIFFVSSGTEAMERIIQNCVEKYSFHFVNGSFSKRFFETAKELGKSPQKVENEFGKGFDVENIEIPKKTEIICLTQNETSTGVMIPVDKINKIAKTNSDKLMAIDIVSSVPYVNMNYKLLDVVFFSVQKGFGLPAGLGVMIVSPKAMKKSNQLAEKNIVIGSYHSFSSLLKYAEKNQTPDTPPVLEIYLLGKVIEDMLKTGIKKIRQQTEEKAKLIYDLLDNHQILSAFVRDTESRSQTVIVANVKDKQKIIKQKLEKNGLIVGSGYGEYKESQIRIANLPAHSISDIKKLVNSLKALKF